MPIALLIFTMIMAILAVIDHRQNRLPDALTLPTMWLGLIINVESVFAPLAHAVVGAVCGYIFIRIIHDTEVLMRGRPSIGLGDAKLLAAIGAWYGPFALPVLVAGAALLTLIVYLGRHEKPFGVGLATAATVYGAVKTSPNLSLLVSLL